VFKICVRNKLTDFLYWFAIMGEQLSRGYVLSKLKPPVIFAGIISLFQLAQFFYCG